MPPWQAFAARCLPTSRTAALDFLRVLNREFPADPDVLYLSVHTYSDLSSRAASELAARPAIHTRRTN